MNNIDFIIVGAGFSGMVTGRQLAEQNKKILIVEKRSHIGGNCYDHTNENMVLTQLYGPHIFHTNHERVYNYLSNFTKWYNNKHKVVADINGDRVVIPFNFSGIDQVFDEKADMIKEKLIKNFGEDSKVSAFDLMENDDEDLRNLGFYVYENIFLFYAKKKWSYHLENLDINTFGTAPIYLSYADTYFNDKWQGLPADGYTNMFNNIANHENITINYNTDIKDLINFKDNNILVRNKVYNGKVIFTGCVDQLFDYKFGKLSYRTLDFDFDDFDLDKYQSHGVINYTKDRDFLRISEFKYLTGQKLENKTTIVREYSREYNSNQEDIPFYPIPTGTNLDLYKKYLNFSSKFEKLYLLGSLAEYKYYNMDTTVLKALELSDLLKEKI